MVVKTFLAWWPQRYQFVEGLSGACAMWASASGPEMGIIFKKVIAIVIFFRSF